MGRRLSATLIRRYAQATLTLNKQHQRAVGLVLRTSLISSALGACPRQTHNRWRQRFNLRKGQSWCVSDRRIRMRDDATNWDPLPRGPTIVYAPPTVFGTPTSAMKGEGLKDHAVPAHEQESCCMCFELRNGVVCLASIKLLVYSILSILLTKIVIVSVNKVDVDPVILGIDSKIYFVGLLIVSLIVDIPMNIIGIVGAIQRRKNFVYAYFLYFIVIIFLSMVVLIASIFVPGAFAPSPVFVGISILSHLYYAYSIRRLYLRILIENAGHYNYTQV